MGNDQWQLQRNEHTALTEKHNALVEKRGVENTQLATVKQLARKLRDEKTAALADNVKIQVSQIPNKSLLYRY